MKELGHHLKQLLSVRALEDGLEKQRFLLSSVKAQIMMERAVRLRGGWVHPDFNLPVATGAACFAPITAALVLNPAVIQCLASVCCANKGLCSKQGVLAGLCLMGLGDRNQPRRSVPTSKSPSCSWSNGSCYLWVTGRVWRGICARWRWFLLCLFNGLGAAACCVLY